MGGWFVFSFSIIFIPFFPINLNYFSYISFFDSTAIGDSQYLIISEGPEISILVIRTKISVMCIAMDILLQICICSSILHVILKMCRLQWMNSLLIYHIVNVIGFKNTTFIPLGHITNNSNFNNTHYKSWIFLNILNYILLRLSSFLHLLIEKKS